MALLKSVRGFTPKIGKNCFLAENASLIGEVTCGDDCSFWFNAVVRADVNRIKIGNRCNIQDGAVIHCTYKTADTIIGDDVSIGHNAIVHGCHIGNRVLIGMGAIIMDKVEIPDYTIVAAGSIVPPGRKLESGFIYAGNPARKLKEFSEEQKEFLIERTSRNYMEYASWFSE
jgi:carbonic anhydrase/acetyltransferase-like protein (isoleucine patch superfamily)